QFFANPSCDPSGYGQGQIFLGEQSVLTSLTGNVDFTATFVNNTLPPNSVFTATATFQFDTSEFSKCLAPSKPPPPPRRAAEVTLLSPAKWSNSASPAFIWQAVDGAQRYNLLLKGPDGTVTSLWFDAARICSDGTCTAHLETPLSEDKYEWRVRAAS